MTNVGSRLTTALTGHYRIEREIGRGGMATVYLATDLRHGRPVAIKVLRKDVSGSIGADRFLREIQIAARLTHPNILPLYDSGHVEELLYYVMPYVEGRSLRDILDERKQLPLYEAIEIAGEIADALAYAHEQGVVHRDIKPANILVESGHAVVCDFGIAKALAEAAGGTAISKKGVAIGTPSYMSPEQATGEDHIDGRADIYALGCVLYEMLIGEPPFTGPTAQAILARHAVTPPPSLRTVRDTIPPWLELSIHRALSKNPADRFPEARALRDALRPRDPGSSGEFIRARRLSYRNLSILLMLIIAATGIIMASTRFARSGKSVQDLVARRVVVAPFANRTGAQELDAIGVMAADWITQGLQATAMLDVVPTATALQSARYIDGLSAEQRAALGRSASDPIRLLAEETLAGTVISGAYYREGDSLQFQAQIADVRGKRLLAAPDPVTAPVAAASAAIEEMRTRVMGSLANSFDTRLKGFSGEVRQPPRYESYRAYAAGIQSYVNGQSVEALRHFDQSAQLDSTFVSALFFASLSRSNLGQFAAADSLLRKAEAKRNRLSEYDRDWLDYRQALMRGDRPKALAAIRRAATASPGSKAVYNLAVEAIEGRHLDLALDALKQLTPERGAMRGWVPYWDALTSVLHMKNDHREEFRVAKSARRLYPTRQIAIAMEVRALAAMGDFKGINSRLADSRALPQEPNSSTSASVMREAADELRAHGHRDAAMAVERQLLQWYESRPDKESAQKVNRWGRAITLYQLKRYGDAARVADSLLTEYPEDLNVVGLRGTTALRMGDIARASAIDESLKVAVHPYSFGLQTRSRALMAAVKGDKAKAVALLQHAFNEGRPFDLWVHRHADLESLRGYPPFEALLKPRS